MANHVANFQVFFFWQDLSCLRFLA
jgi:hypothetical protein